MDSGSNGPHAMNTFTGEVIMTPKLLQVISGSSSVAQCTNCSSDKLVLSRHHTAHFPTVYSGIRADVQKFRAPGRPGE
jgi:hypothetical protein